MTKKVVLADDDVFLLHIAKAILANSIYSLITFTNGHELLKHLPRNSDLIILDVLMGNTNGLEICRIFKSTSSTAAIPIIMISAHEDVRRMAFEVGADGALKKPFTKNELLSIIKEFVL